MLLESEAVFVNFSELVGVKVLDGYSMVDPTC